MWLPDWAGLACFPLSAPNVKPMSILRHGLVMYGVYYIIDIIYKMDEV